VVIARSDLVGDADLPARVREGAPTAHHPTTSVPRDASVDFKERIKQQTRAYETEIIVEALRQAGGNQTEAARRLQMPVRTLTHKMKELDIKKTFR
jgi:two-component system response regulator AtoC